MIFNKTIRPFYKTPLVLAVGLVLSLSVQSAIANELPKSAQQPTKTVQAKTSNNGKQTAPTDEPQKAGFGSKLKSFFGKKKSTDTNNPSVAPQNTNATNTKPNQQPTAQPNQDVSATPQDDDIPPTAIPTKIRVVKVSFPTANTQKTDGNSARTDTNTQATDEEEVSNDYDFSTLDNAPDPLANIEGLNPTRVPLNAISPDTLRTFVTVIDTVRRQYVNEVNDEQLFQNAMAGMLKKVDTYGEYLDKTALENLRAFTEGTVASVGLVVDYSLNQGQWVVSYVVPDSSADKAGIRTGDYLHDIAGVRLNDTQSNQDITQMLSGIAGSQLDVVVSHAGRGKHTITLQRSVEQHENLTAEVKDGIAHITLPVFTGRTKDELLGALIRTNQPIFGVMIDMRNNPGGVLSSAVDVAGLFLPKTPVVQVVGKDKKPNTLTTTANAPLTGVPVMILQNRYSASAAEVLSSAFLANGAIIAGETSYGKGSVQTILPIGKDEAIKLTTAHYQMANGTKIDGVGVKPTLTLDFDNADWLNTALTALNEKRLAEGILLKDE